MSRIIPNKVARKAFFKNITMITTEPLSHVIPYGNYEVVTFRPVKTGEIKNGKSVATEYETYWKWFARNSDGERIEPKQEGFASSSAAFKHAENYLNKIIMELEEKLELLANFEGIRKSGTEYILSPLNPTTARRYEQLTGTIVDDRTVLRIEKLKYNTSWDWIQPLFNILRVKLHEQLRADKEAIMAEVLSSEPAKHPLITFSQEIIFDILPNTSSPLEWTFDWCVRFVEWYNKNKKNVYDKKEI